MDESIEAAIRMSETEAEQREQSDLHDALLRSKVHMPPLRDDVVMLKLSRRTTDVVNELLKSPLLQDVRSRVMDAGCQILPEWSSGAVLLVPLTAEQVFEAEIELRAHHILARRCDMTSIKDALSALPKRRRPKVKFELGSADRDDAGDGSDNPEEANVDLEGAGEEVERTGPLPGMRVNGSDGPLSREGGRSSSSDALSASDGKHSPRRIELIVEKTFLNFPLPKDDTSECSRNAQSAPCGSLGHAEPPNPRRWRP